MRHRCKLPLLCMSHKPSVVALAQRTLCVGDGGGGGLAVRELSAKSLRWCQVCQDAVCVLHDGCVHITSKQTEPDARQVCCTLVQVGWSGRHRRHSLTTTISHLQAGAPTSASFVHHFGTAFIAYDPRGNTASTARKPLLPRVNGSHSNPGRVLSSPRVSRSATDKTSASKHHCSPPSRLPWTRLGRHAQPQATTTAAHIPCPNCGRCNAAAGL